MCARKLVVVQLFYPVSSRDLIVLSMRSLLFRFLCLKKRNRHPLLCLKGDPIKTSSTIAYVVGCPFRRKNKSTMVIHPSCDFFAIANWSFVDCRVVQVLLDDLATVYIIILYAQMRSNSPRSPSFQKIPEAESTKEATIDSILSIMPVACTHLFLRVRVSWGCCWDGVVGSVFGAASSTMSTTITTNKSRKRWKRRCQRCQLLGVLGR